MTTLDGRLSVADSVVYQHKSIVGSRSAADGDEVCDFDPTVAPIGYEGDGLTERFSGFKLVDPVTASADGSLPVKPGRGLKAKAHPKRATHVTQCVESFPLLSGDATAQADGARIALAHNVGGPTTGPTVSFLEGPAANGS